MHVSSQVGRLGHPPVLQRVVPVAEGGCVAYWLDKTGCVVRVGRCTELVSMELCWRSNSLDE